MFSTVTEFPSGMKFSDKHSKEIQFTIVNRATKIYAYIFKKLKAWLKATHSIMSIGVKAARAIQRS